MNTHRKILFLCLLLISSTFFGCQPGSEDHVNQSGGSMPGPDAQSPKASLAIHFPDSAVYQYDFELREGATVGEAMTDHPAIRIEMKEYTGMGRLVTGIYGYQNNRQHGWYWQFCVNGTVAAKGIDDTEMQDGDQVDWHLVPYNALPCKKIGE